jgi:hypothetical protein
MESQAELVLRAQKDNCPVHRCAVNRLFKRCRELRRLQPKYGRSLGNHSKNALPHRWLDPLIEGTIVKLRLGTPANAAQRCIRKLPPLA